MHCAIRSVVQGRLSHAQVPFNVIRRKKLNALFRCPRPGFTGANFTISAGTHSHFAWPPPRASHPDVFHVVCAARLTAAPFSWHALCTICLRQLSRRPEDFTRQNNNPQKRKTAMSVQTLKGNWHIAKGKLKQKYADLTDNDLRYIEGKEEELIGRIQKITGATREEIVRLLAYTDPSDESITP
jgi:uncharacterized protein YjbJ (UPF0337 family)